MNKQTQQKLNQLFNRFANETQASSFAMESLLNKTFGIIQEGEKDEIQSLDTKNANKDNS